MRNFLIGARGTVTFLTSFLLEKLVLLGTVNGSASFLARQLNNYGL